MAIKSDRGIYRILESHLRKATTPLTCAELMDLADVRKEAVAEFGGEHGDVQEATNELSNAVRHMWTRGILVRYPAPKNSTSKARFAYKWHDGHDEQINKPISLPVRHTGKLPMTITQHADGVEIDFGNVVVYIKPKT